ncbi:hypothetical protein GJAV_G00111310 [Gymnothorax javanicus]|nr:hypothetical protein GJAV_G00111310 [Gymnothorax javanicus]
MERRPTVQRNHCLRLRFIAGLSFVSAHYPANSRKKDPANHLLPPPWFKSVTTRQTFPFRFGWVSPIHKPGAQVSL